MPTGGQMLTIVKSTACFLVLTTASACVSEPGSERPAEPVTVMAGSSAGSVSPSSGALELQNPPAIGGIVHEPCQPEGQVSSPQRTKPQIEVGLAVPVEGRKELLGAPVPYAAYRCK